MLAAPSVHAGSYTDTSSGTTILPIVTPAADTTYSAPEDAIAYSSVTPYSPDGDPTYTININPGTLTDAFNWTHGTGETDANDPPPTCVIVEQTSWALWFVRDEGGTASGSGTVICGLPGAVITPFTYGGEQVDDPSAGLSAVLYSVKTSPGASFSVSCNPTASFTGTTGTEGSVEGEAKTGSGANAYPVTINPFGATSDGNGGWVIMIGEHFTPELAGIPSNCTMSNYQWSVTGTTLQSWTVSSDSKQTTEVDGPGALNIATPGWYWNDLKNKDETVTCTATVTPPSGQGSPFTVTASQLVSVYVPIWTGTGTGGYVKVNNYPTSTNSSQYYIFTGPTLNMILDGDTDGMSFNATVDSPVPDLISAGSLQLVQLVTPREATTTFNGYDTAVHFFPQYGEEGLDGAYPYGWITESNPPGPFTYYTGDTPYILLLDQITYAATLKHDFQDFLMFLAPGSQQPVPVAHFIWSDDGNAQIPSTGFWKDYASEHGGSDSVGTVTPSGNDATFLPSNVFPMWTQID
jgi:hypothetical protein